MTNEEKLKAIVKHQNAGIVHPMTCGNDSQHQDLVGKEIDGEVRLVCLDCNWVQSIPECVLEFSPHLDGIMKHMQAIGLCSSDAVLALRAERAEVERILEMTPKENVIDRASYEARLKNIDERLLKEYNIK